MDFDAEFVDRHPVLEVAVEAIGLLDEEDPDCRVLPEERQHLGEIRAAALFGGLDVDVLCDNRYAVDVGIVLEKLELGGDREAFSLLLLGGDSRVDDGALTGRLRRLRRTPDPG
ncbi:hypothetical protein ASD38_16400 [Caulobacter sp. Root487D2Y]|nr:hypothetical protein ASD38_16400 [Caulobacter sp. Root487D2Y]